MNHVELLGENLKCDFLCDLFETYDVEVVYEYDRTHEGIADEYRAEIPDLGLQFVFDENHRLRTLFTRLVEIQSFCPIAAVPESTPLFDSKEEVLRYTGSHDIRTTEGSAEFMGEVRDWVRLEHTTHSVHYEFVQSNLDMITFQIEGA